MLANAPWSVFYCDALFFGIKEEFIVISIGFDIAEARRLRSLGYVVEEDPRGTVIGRGASNNEQGIQDARRH